MTAVEDLSIVHDRMHAKKMMAVYGYSGKFGPWKEYSDQLYGPSEAIQTYHNLYRQGIIPSYDKDFVFVSPTANSATHEYAMWQIDQQLRIGRGVFVTADIISNPPVFTQTAGQNSVINHVRWNAREFPIRDGSADYGMQHRNWK